MDPQVRLCSCIYMAVGCLAVFVTFERMSSHNGKIMNECGCVLNNSRTIRGFSLV